jgi:hypothetical protein
MRLLIPVLLTVAIAAGAAQAQPLRRLTQPVATFAEPFTSVSGVRELRDGRVLVSDARDRTLQVIDLRTGDAVAVGREGSGPGEFGVPTRLFAMPGDSTLMSDFQNGRYLIILPDGKPGPTFRVPESSPAFFGSLIGVDARGRLLLERARTSAAEGPMAASVGIADVLRFDRASQRTDTLGQLRTPRGERSGARVLPGGMLQTFTNLPFATRDVAGVTPGGDLALVRAAGYRVEWIGADGGRRTGAPAAASNVRITQAEREAFVKSRVRPGAIIVSGGAQAAQRAAGSSGGARAAAPTFSGDVDALFSPDMVWPDVKPPFLADAARAADDGSVWVLRTRAHDDPTPTFDVFDREGRVTMRVAIPAGTRLVGFGKSGVYVVRSDEDDLQYLERYAYP